MSFASIFKHTINIHMRAQDLPSDLNICLDGIDASPRYITALSGSEPVGFALLSRQPGSNIVKAHTIWIAESQGSGLVIAKMKSAMSEHGLDLVFESQQLDELDIKRIAKAAALGAGVLGGAYGLTGNGSKQATEIPQVAQTTQMVRPSAIATPVDDAKADTQQQVKDEPHPNYPQELLGLRSVDPTTRVNTFKKILLPMIDRQNANITRQRQSVIRMVSKIHRGKGLSPDESQWLQGMMAKYGTKDPMELIKRVDVIPRSMALAQAAVESGWGQDDLAQKANVFYGQKTFKPDAGVAGTQGERYSAFSDPEDSVRAYMQNLNTHAAYDQFRDNRAKMRAAGKPLRGTQLVNSLQRYSTLGKDYISKVNKVITSRGLDKLDQQR